MDEPKKEESLAEELRLLGDSLFQFGRTAFEKSRAFSIDAMRKARSSVDKAREDLEKSGKGSA
jgi:hypothetical protein